MRFQHIKRLLCIATASTMLVSGTANVTFADLLTSEPVDEMDDASSEEAIIDPIETPVVPSEEAVVTPTDAPIEPTATMAPVEPSETPLSPTETPLDPTIVPVSPTEMPLSPTEMPVDPTDTPTPTLLPTATPVPAEDEIAAIIEDLIHRIDVLSRLSEITLEQQEEIQEIRRIYDTLTVEQQQLVTNADAFLEMEDKLSSLLSSGTDELTDGTDLDEIASQIGTAVYYTNYVSNLHAGKEFYLNSLKDNYGISFSEDFAEVMEEIEEEYKSKYKLQDVSDQKKAKTTSSEDVLLVRNWQDILAIYIYQHQKQGETTFALDSSDKKELAKIFAEMNPVERDKDDVTKVAYGNRHINYYIKKYNIGTDGREILKKYTETDCKLLCAVVTAAKGFVRESVGDSVSEERVNVIAAAYSLIGEVGYFYGGKSTVIGTDESWGQAETVTAEGSTSTGTLRAYGLDCSGFVTWAVINGYQNTDMQEAIGDGTSEQWEKANIVSESDAQPGDLVFLAGPELTGADNHVGIICGKTDAGDWIAVHCSSSKNGVTVGEAYSASFRYIRQPSFYPTQEEAAEMAASGQAVSDLLTDHSEENASSQGTSSTILLVDDAETEPFDPDVDMADLSADPDSLSEFDLASAESQTNAAFDSSTNVLSDTSQTEPFDISQTEPFASSEAYEFSEETSVILLIDNSVVEPF